jgi:hypothetical protein
MDPPGDDDDDCGAAVQCGPGFCCAQWRYGSFGRRPAFALLSGARNAFRSCAHAKLLDRLLGIGDGHCCLHSGRVRFARSSARMYHEFVTECARPDRQREGWPVVQHTRSDPMVVGRWIHDSGTAEAIGAHGAELSAVKGLRRGRYVHVRYDTKERGRRHGPR